MLICASGGLASAGRGTRAAASRTRAPRACSVPSQAMLYSLLHLGGFPGDVDFYRGRTAGAARILELGAGDGRVGAVLCADAQYTGVEICAEFATAARERVDGTVLEADMFAPLPEGTACFVSGKPAKCWVLWGRSY